MKLAFREELTPGDTLQERLAWLAAMGIEGIELSTGSLDLEPDELRRVFDDSPVKVVNVAGSTDLLHPETQMRSNAIELTKYRLHLAGLLGASAGVLLVPQFGRRSKLPDLTPYQSAVELETVLLDLQLQALIPSAKEACVPILLEPLNRYEAHLVNRLEDGAAIANRIGPEVKVMADFFHMNIEEVDIAMSIHQARDHIAHVHVADSNRLQPGRGHLDFGPGLSALKAIGYEGYIGIECGIDGPFDESVAASATLLRAWWAEA